MQKMINLAITCFNLAGSVLILGCISLIGLKNLKFSVFCFNVCTVIRDCTKYLNYLSLFHDLNPMTIMEMKTYIFDYNYC